MRRLSLVALVFCLLLTACTSLVPTVQHVEAPGQARVVVDRVKGDTIWLLVYNLTDQPMTIDRDAMRFEIDGKSFDRDRGAFGIASRRFHEVPPGGVHDVRLEYGITGVGAGRTAVLYLDHAIVSRGAPLAIPPVTFRTE